MTETLLSDLTTLGVGGPAASYAAATSTERLVDAVARADAAGEPLLVLGGGSNLLIGDAGFAGTVVHVRTRGVEISERAGSEGVLLRAAAGEPWDELVARAVDSGLSGLETLSGIPGTTGATPVQNVGAYGTEISQLLTRAFVYDRRERRRLELSRDELAFSYRDSRLKRETMGHSPRYVVLEVEFALPRSAASAPIRYAELARVLGVEVGESAPAAEVRRAVLGLRAGKGMVLDAGDRDTFSTGSFFTNPIVPAGEAGAVPDDAPRYPVLDPAGEVDASRIKLSAAWLIQHAGFTRGFGLDGEAAGIAGGRSSLSTKHTLAVTNRGGASAGDVLAIARTVRDGVQEAFGVRLEAEPVLLGVEL
ncbi:UDP-N-acetylmuramate dehydrogenase [Rothia halotolerans]|uniref:UDP-N-acetylmuramate dehydrogenase n=1 Tax=Rothia halotolerans TaxID=405770 RepID=UPI00101BB957|nr:UDP-N-acetylmuramate dehydrogenase [Rothia halotolerans]